MAVVGLYLAKRAEGSASATSVSCTLYYKVFTDKYNDGPKQVLDSFAFNKTYDWLNTENPFDASSPYSNAFYKFPASQFFKCKSDIPGSPDQELPLGPFGGPFYEFPEIASEYNWHMPITDLRVIQRLRNGVFDEVTLEAEPGKETIWLIQATYTQSASGPYTPTRVTPYYVPKQESVPYGVFMGFYNREPNIQENDEDGPSSRWEKKTIVNRSLTNTEGEPLTRVRPVTNSAIIPYLPQMKITRFQQAYKLTWVSRLNLDFSETINKVNKNCYTLKGMSCNLAADLDPMRLLPFNRRKINNAQEQYNKHTIFCHKFAPRELLLRDISSQIEVHNNRTYYRYTLDFLYDEFGHDVFVLDEGKKVSAADPSQEDDRASNIGSYNQFRDPADPNYTRGHQGFEETMSIKTLQGTPSRETYLLNGAGNILNHRPGISWATGNSKHGTDPYPARFLRWRIYQDADFGVATYNAALPDIDDDTLPEEGTAYEKTEVPWGQDLQVFMDKYDGYPDTEKTCAGEDGSQHPG